MEISLPPIVVLDACVLYPAPLRDLLLNLADNNIFQPKWSDEINAEWVRNLAKNRSDLSQKRLYRTVNAMNNAFPNANINPTPAEIEILVLPDLNDRHVLATAIKAEAESIITANLKDFPAKAVNPFNIMIQHPDIFILDLLAEQPNEVLAAFKTQVARLKNPPRSAEDVLASLGKNGLKKSVAVLAKLL